MKSVVCAQMNLNPAVSICAQLISIVTVYERVALLTVKSADCLQVDLNPPVSVCKQLTDNLYIEYISIVTNYKSWH